MNTTVMMDDKLSISRGEVTPGYDENMKHVEAIVRFYANGNKVTVTCYNTTQRIKVEGKGYLKFIEQFLKPFLIDKLNRIDPNKIDNYNKEVIAALSGKRKVVSRPMRSVRYKVMAKLDCPKCDLTFLNEGQLKKHKKIMHTKGPNDSSSSLKNIPSVNNISLLEISEGNIEPPESNNLQIEYVREETRNAPLTYVKVEPITNIQSKTVLNVAEDLNKPVDRGAEEEKLLDKNRKDDLDEITVLDEAPQQEVQLSCNEISVCPFCNIQAKNLEELKEHIENVHISSVKSEDKQQEIIEIQKSETCTKCKECDYIGYKDELSEHIQVEHIKAFSCKNCQKSFSDTNTLNNHIEVTHMPSKQDVSLPCEWCDLHFSNINLLQDHTLKYHTPKPENCQYCDKKFKTKEEFKSHMEEAHEEVMILFNMANQVNQLTGEVAKYKELLKQVLENQTEMKQELFIIRNEQTKNLTVNQVNDDIVTKEVKKADESTKPFTACLIGDSISANIDHKVVSRALGKELRTARAYSNTNDGAENEAKEATKFPDKNFDKVIKDELMKAPTDTLIIQAGSIDITNFKTTNDKLERFREYYKQETVVAANNLFSAVTDALNTNPELKKVIIMKQIPRYDTKANDSSAVKSLLSKLFNTTLDQLLLRSEYQDKITIGTHRLECEGGIRDSRYRNNNRYDGIHMVGPSGKKAYTESVLCIMRSAGHMKNDPPRYFRRFHESVSQTKPEVTYFCPTQDTDYLNDRDVRTYAQVVRSPAYTVPTANRFSPLYQENY